MIRIALADDHAIVRTGFRALIEREADMRIVGECGSIAECERALVDNAADVLVLDLTLRGESGIEALPSLRAQFPALHILVMSMHEGESYVDEALARGADGYVTKAVAPDELVAGIREVMAGRRYLSSDLRGRKPAAVPLDRLSAREHEVFLLLAHGKTIKQAADALGVAAKTAYVHRAHVLEKLGARNDRELYRIALAGGLIEG
ncbi:MAG: response regulator transcription factor [Proteobacteria bacterium]|nr:response regulator transcription factor [Pseudomonadota bacterium]